MSVTLVTTEKSIDIRPILNQHLVNCQPIHVHMSCVSVKCLPVCQPSVDQVHSVARHYRSTVNMICSLYAYVFCGSWLMCWVLQNC